MTTDICTAVRAKKIVAIMRDVPYDKLLPLTNALMLGGIELCEVTVPQSDPDGLSKTVKSIERISQEFPDKMIVGAGTVITEVQLDGVMSAGARFIISPNSDREVIERTKKLGGVSIPGALTPTEIVSAYEWGADFVKVFPVDLLGSAYIKAIAAPLSHIPLMAVGGIGKHNISQFIAAGCSTVGIGGSLISKTAIENDDWDAITSYAKALVMQVE